MPLILIAGNPCTGKTTFANQLVDYLKSRGVRHIELINEEQLKITKQSGYKTSFNEKSTRGLLKSAADHKLNTECYVIVDSLNYIKGFRYELYCSARTFRTPHCVVWVESDEEYANTWNPARMELTGDGYDDMIMRDLRRRFEAPNEANRWDSPLFRVRMGATAAAAESIVASDVVAAVSSPDIASVAASVVVDPPKKTSWRPKKSAAAASDCSVSGASVVPSVAPSGTGGDASSGGGNSVFFSGTQARRDKDLLAAFSPAEEALPRIAAYLLEAVAPAPNSSTVAAQHAEPDLLYELDRTSQGILATLLAHQSENVEGTPVKFAEFDREITLHRHAGLAELQRHRRQFVKINGRNPPATSRAVGALFIDFLANQL